MITALLLSMALGARQEPRVEERVWDAWLVVPGGKLGFGLDFERTDGGWSAFLVNGAERIEVPRTTFDGEELVLDMPHYDSRIRARFDGRRFAGTWEKRRSAESRAQVPFEAEVPPACDMPGPGGRIHAGRWRVDFESDDEDAIAVFETSAERGGLRGTFLTATGDYRYLAGSGDSSGLRLSCFDGAHAFLFTARAQPDGTLQGDFWSGNWHHETWTARRDDSATLADPFAQTRWNGTTRLADLAFPDLGGVKRPLGELAGKATLLVVFGSWCPNCHDEAELLRELDAKYRARGLRILGLAFELTGEFARDAEQVRRFAERHALSIPTFLCGTADKAEATKALGLVDRVRAFPTTVFVGGDGLVKAVHSGFAGPATGEEHAALRREFERRIEELLGGS